MAGKKGASGGARPGAGALVKRLNLSKDTATILRMITQHRRAITGNQELQPLDVVTQLIQAEAERIEWQKQQPTSTECLSKT